MTLSFNKLNEIAELYESIAASEQEQLDEGPIDVEKSAKLERGIANFFTSKPRLTPAEMRASTSGVPVPKSPAEKPKPERQEPIVPDRIKNAKPPSQQAKQEYAKSKGKYYSSSDQKTYKSEADAKAARAGRLKDLAATQAAAKAKNSSSDNSQSSRNPQPPASSTLRPTDGGKVAPTKPAAPAKPAMGTTAGGTKFERRAATGAELAAARKARDEAKAAGNTKGAEEAAVKAGVDASKPSTLAAATTAASKPAAFKPATINAASSTSASASGDTYKYKPNSSLMKNSFEYDAYDLVLEYLLSQGHAETVAEAQYLMIEMDSEMIGEIVEGIADRTANAVGHQRAGTLGDADEMRKNQDATSASIGKMKRGSGAKVTPTLPGV